MQHTTIRTNDLYRGHLIRRTFALFAALLLSIATTSVLAQSDHIRQYAEAVGAPEPDPRGPAEGTPQFGGVLHIAMDREHPHFDPHRTTLNHVVEFSNHVAEALFALGADSTPHLSLAEGYEVSDDGTVYTITLRSGVPFHNGKILAAEDVVASLERYLELGVYGAAEVARNVESVEEVDDLTVRITLTQPYPFILYQLSSPIGGAPFIYPKELIEEVGDGQIRAPIGTGPYQFVQYRENEFSRIERFEDYVGRTDPPSGYAGGRVAYLDAIVFHYVPDESVRVAGVQTGEYHVAIGIAVDVYTLFENDPDVRSRIVNSTWPAFNFNKRSGPMTDQRIRDAFRIAIDSAAITTALGPPQFTEVDPGLVFPDSPWHSTVGEDTYLEHDTERARALLEEAEYDGRAIRILIDPSRAFLYTPALVARPMLEAAGFTIEFVPVDSATYATYRADPDRMDVFAAAYSPRQDPTLIVSLGSGHPGWWDTDEKTALMTALHLEDDFDARFELWEQLQAHFYDYTPMIKLGNLADFNIESTNYSGTWFEVAQRYWLNTWLN